MTRIEEDTLRRGVNWDHAWNQFYDVGQVQAPQVKGYSQRDKIAGTEASVMYNGDCFIPPVIPSSISDSSGVRVHVGNLNGRPLFVEAPKGLFEYVPKWLRDVRRQDMIDQSERLLGRVKDRLRKDLTQLAQGVVAVISRVSTDALVNLGHLFLRFQVSLARIISRQAKRVAPAASTFVSWLAKSSKRFFQGLAAATKQRWSSFMALLTQ